MDSEQRLIFRLYDEASAKLKILQNNLRGFNTSYSTRVNLSVNDQITPRLTTIYQQMTSKFGAFLLRLKIDDSSTSVISKLKKTLNAMFGTDESKKWYEKIYGYLSKLGQLAAKTGTIITGIFGIGGAVLTAGMVIGVASMSKKMITLNSEMEQYKVSLQTSVGSLTAAKKEMEAIIKFAKQTPYTIQEVTQATVRLRAYAMDPETWLEPLGNAASAFGRDLTDAVEMAADYVQNQFRRAMSYGIRGSADDFKQGGKFAGQSAADALLTTLNQRFASGMRLQAQTFKGIISNIKDTMTVELAEISAPMFSAAKGILVSFYKSLADGSALGGIKQAIADASASISKILRAMTNLHNYAKRNIIPMFKDTASAMMTTFKSIVEVVGAVSEAMGSPILIVLANVLHALAVIVKNAQWAIKIFVGYKVIATIFKLLSHNIAETGVKLLTTGKAASMFGAQLSIIAQRAVLAGAAILAMINISKFLEINSGLKQLGNSFDQIAGGAGKVKGYLKDLGNETGHTLDNMVKAAQASESFGDNAVNSLEYGARIANTLEMSTENAVQSVGKLAAAFIVIGDNSQAMAQKTEQAATALVYLKQQSEELNVSFDQVQTLMEQFPEVVAKSTNGMIGLVEIIAAASKSGKDLTKVFAALSMLSTPDFAMLTTLDPTIWVSRTSSELLDLGKNMDKLKDSDKDLASSMVASAEGVIAILDKYGKAGRVITDEFGRVQSSATIGVQEIISTLKDLDRQLKIAQEETVKWGAEVIRLESQLTEWGIELQRINIEIDKYTKKLEEANNMQPFGAKAYHKAVTDLGIAMNRLDLEKAKAELALLDKTYVQIEKDIIKMNAAIKKEEGALAPLKRRLGDITDEFNSISDAIQDAQEKLDKFTNPKLKGMGAFDDKIHSLDMQLNSLERQRLDIAKGLQPFEDAGLTDTSAYKNASAQLTALDAQIAKIENEKRKTELDRSIAYDDQLYKLEKIADTQKEITFSEALKGAQAARAEIDKLQPQMERVKAQKDALEDEVDLRQQSIDKQKRLVEQKQSELDAARSINEAAINELELQEKIYQATKDKLDAEHLVSMEKIIQAKADLERSKIYETSAQNAADAITSAQINLDSLQAQADNLGLKISQGSYDRDRVNTKYQDSQAKVTELQGDIKALVGFIPDFIKSVNYTKFVSEDMEQIATAFGSEDYATLFNDMNDTLENIDTSLATIVAQSGSGGLGFFGDMKNLATGSAAGTIATTIGTIAAAVLLKKGAGKLTSAIGKKIATSAAAGGGLATTLESKAVIRTLPKDYMKQLGLAVNKTQTDADKALVSLVKKLDRAEINRQAGERIISQKLANIDPDDVKGMDKLLLKNDEKFKDALTKIDTERRFIEKTAKDKIEGLGSVMEKAKTNRLTPTDGKIIKNIIEETGSTSKVIRTAAKNMEKEAGLARRALATLVALPILGRGAGKLGQGMASGGSLLTRMRSVGYGGAQTIGDAQSIGNGNIITRVVRRLEGQIAGKVLGRVKNQRGAASIEALTFGLGGMLENRGAKAALSTADELRAGGTRTISTKMAMQAASQYGPDGKLNVQDDLVKRYAAEAKKTGKVAESIGGLKVTAVIDKTTGEIAIIDGHNRIAAAKKAGIKTIQADFSTGNWQELMGDVKKRVPGKVFPNVAELEKSGGALSRVLGKAVAPLGKLAAPLSALMNSKAGTGLKIAGKAGMFAGFGDVSQLAKPVENALAKVGMKAAGSIAGKGLGFLGKTLLGGGVAGIASLGVQAVNFLKGDFMNDKVWSRLFGGKTIQEFTKDNPVSRYLYSAFGKDNVEQMFKPLGNIWDAATNLSGAVGNVGGMATGLVKGIFTGDYKGMINNAKDFAANVGEAFFDLGNAAVNQVKSFGAAGSAFKNFFTGGSDYSAATEKLQQTQLQNAEAYGKKAIDMMKEINETKDLDQREALRAQYYIHVKDIQQKQDNMSAGVAIAKQYGEQIIQLQDAVSQAVDDDTREMYRAQLYAYQKALKDLQSTGKITPEIISSLNYDIFEINSSLREMKIPLVYDEETFNDIMSRYAKTKSDLENPIKVLIEAEIAKDSWNQAYMNMAGMAAKVMSLFGTSGRSSEQILNDAYNKVTGQGSSGGNTAVAALQSRLNQFGYGLTVDNQMGSKTRGAAQDLISKLQAEISTLTGGDRSKAKDLIREIESVLNSYQTGGITDWARSQAKLAVLHGQEAVIPLQNGYVPVTITGGNSAQGGSQPQVINNVSNTFTVRNDDDIETLKKYMLKIMQGQTGFTDNPFNYV